MSVRSVSVFAFALFSAALLGLAGGAVWLVASMYLRQPLPWLAVPVGALLAWAMRHSVHTPGVVTGLLAAFATALATVYLNMLIAGVRLAGNMGLGLVDAMRTAGISMLWQLSQLTLTPADIGWALLAMALAAWLGWRSPHKR